MKTNKLIIIFAILALVCILPGGLTPGSVQAGDQNEPGENGMILLISPPDLNSLTLPENLSLGYARTIVQRAMQSNARLAMKNLRTLQADGLLGEAQLVKDGTAIRVKDVRSPERLISLPGVKLEESLEEPDGCLSRELDSLSERLFVRSLSEDLTASLPEAVEVDLSVYLWQYKSEAWVYSYVYGKTGPERRVNLKIKRAGVIILDLTQTSGTDGYYKFEPEWQEKWCSGGYSWALEPGDVVEVKVGSRTEQTVFVDMSAWIDASGDMLMGVTEPGRTIGITLYTSQGDCEENVNHFQVTSDGSGLFNLESFLINGIAHAELQVYDSNGNATVSSVQANHIEVGLRERWIGGAWKPGVAFRAELVSNNTVLSTYQGMVGPGGSYTAYFDQEIEYGDTVRVSGGGFQTSLAISDLTDYFDDTANTYYGTLPPLTLFRVHFIRANNPFPLQTSCSAETSCDHAASNWSGSFYTTAGFDLRSGDAVYLEIYDSNWNFQFATRQSRVILAEPAWDFISGIWRDTWYSSPLKITLRDNQMNIKEIGEVEPYSADGYFYLFFSEDLVPGDTIEVTDSHNTQSMVVGDLTVEFDANTEHVTGKAAPGHLLARVSDWQAETGEITEYCKEMQNSGDYDFSFSRADTGPFDDVYVLSAGSDGGYTVGDGHTFSVFIQQIPGFSAVFGYAQSPEKAVTINIWNGKPGGDGNYILETETTTSDSIGWFYLEFSMDFEPRQVLEVNAGGEKTNLKIEVITLFEDPANNTVYGEAPEEGLLHVTYVREFTCTKGADSCGHMITQVVRASADGAYSASFQDTYMELWSDYFSCERTQVGSPCTYGWLDYYYPSGHGAFIISPDTGMDSPDGFEPDDDPGSAWEYTGPAVHSFHDPADVDWIRLTIGPDQVNKVLRIATSNLGAIADPVLEIYAADGTTLLASNDDGGNNYAASLEWIPLVEGIYYIRVLPYSEFNANGCSSAYTLSVSGGLIYLPQVGR